MRSCFLALLLITTMSRAQEWQADLMIGGSNYIGDLSQKGFVANTVRPVVNVNLKYELYYIVLRGGLSFTRLNGSDANNKDPYLSNRRLDFSTNLVELSLGIELNLFEPDIFFAYPYIFAGVGLFHYNPHSKDNNGVKTFLHPLHTEGQGFPEYPTRKNYSLTQFCIPLGAGWKVKVNPKWDLAFEFGYRLLTTDYLDDVSKTYAERLFLLNHVGPKAIEMAYKATPIPGSNYYPSAGDQRGNSKSKDAYYFSGVKLIYHFSRKD